MFMKVKHLFYLCIGLLILGCSRIEQRKIDLYQLQKAKVKMDMDMTDDSCAIVDIITYFPNREKCGTNKQLANLYLCRQQSTGDTLYVFADCDSEKSIPFDYNVCIMKSDIKTNIPKEVVVSILRDLVIPKGAKYVFSNLFWLVD